MQPCTIKFISKFDLDLIWWPCIPQKSAAVHSMSDDDTDTEMADIPEPSTSKLGRKRSSSMRKSKVVIFCNHCHVIQYD